MGFLFVGWSVNLDMNKIYKFIMLTCGVLIIVNVFIGLIFDFKWSDMINAILGLILILFGFNYSSKKNKN